MLKKIVKTLLIVILIVLLVPVLLLAGYIVKNRIEYANTLEKAYIEELTDYSRSIREFKKLNNSKEDFSLLTYEKLPPHLTELFVIGVDPDFFTHRGGFWMELLKEIGRSIRGEFTEGEMIEIQVTRALFKINEERSPKSILMAHFAVGTLERNFSKEEILELFLNFTHLDGSTFGIDNFSRHHLNKSATRINAAEAAYLVAMNVVFFPSDDTCSFKQKALLLELEERGKLDKGEAEAKHKLFWQGEYIERENR